MVDIFDASLDAQDVAADILHQTNGMLPHTDLDSPCKHFSDHDPRLGRIGQALPRSNLHRLCFPCSQLHCCGAGSLPFMPTFPQALADISRSRKSVVFDPYFLFSLALIWYLDVCQPAVSNQIIWVYWAFNVTTDLYIISIPLPMLWTTTLKPWRKIGLIFLFSGGIFVVVCATLRCALIVLVCCLYYVWHEESKPM